MPSSSIISKLLVFHQNIHVSVVRSLWNPSSSCCRQRWLNLGIHPLFASSSACTNDLQHNHTNVPYSRYPQSRSMFHIPYYKYNACHYISLLKETYINIPSWLCRSSIKVVMHKRGTFCIHIYRSITKWSISFISIFSNLLDLCPNYPSLSRKHSPL